MINGQTERQTNRQTDKLFGSIVFRNIGHSSEWQKKRNKTYKSENQNETKKAKTKHSLKAYEIQKKRLTNGDRGCSDLCLLPPLRGGGGL